MAVPFIQASFAAGELSPGLYGHVDLNKFHIGLATCRNAFISYRGGAYSRAGTAFVGFSKQTGRTIPPRLITFQFSINEGLALEFGNFYMRVVSNGAFVTETPIAITSASNGKPCSLGIANGWSNGDWIYVSGVGGMTQLNGQTYVVANASTGSVQLNDVYGNPIDSTNFGIYTGGGTAARIYTLATPYAEADIQFLKFTQSADVMSLTCWNQDTNTSYAPYDLTRFADDNWVLEPLAIGSPIAAPAACSGSASSSGTADYNYVATAVDSQGNESQASPIADVSSAVDIAVTAGSITVTWDAVADAAYYQVYRAPIAYDSTVPSGSLLGFAGTVYGNEFVDSNIVPDFTQVPPLHEDPFAPGQILNLTVTGAGASITGLTWTINSATGSGATGFPVIVGGALIAFVFTNNGKNYQNGDTITFAVGSGTAPTGTLNIGPETGTYPSVVAYFQERRVYAGSPNNPDTYWMSQPGTFLNFDSRVPTIDSDAITGTPWSVEVNGIQFMVPMPGGLVTLTGLSAWQVTGAGGSSLNPQPITPASQQAQPQAYNGCHTHIPPINIDYDINYVQSKGSILRDLSYNFFVNIYTGMDLTYLSSQLFQGYYINQMAWCQEPNKIIWVTRNDGILLSLTYLKQQEVMAWARHDTNGQFWSVCAVTEPPVDALYLATQRYPNGNNAYMIERMDDRIWSDVESTWCVDAGLELPQEMPTATLTASSATGAGIPVSAASLIGGSGYSSATTITINDPTGTGCIVTPTIVGGVITALAFAGGTGYTSPQLIANDPTGAGSGFSALTVLDNSAVFVSSVPVFSAASVGQVIRMGGGVATITVYTSPTQVTANLTQPITALIPGTTTPLPQTNPETEFVLSGWTISQPVSVIAGLNHLIGATVTGLADGQVIPPQIVSAEGTITLAMSASAVTVGLGFTTQLQSLYLDAGQPTIQGRRKKIAAVTVRIEASRDFEVGTNQPDGNALSPPQIAPLWSNMQPAVDQGVPAYGSNVVPLFTGDERVPLNSGFAKPGQVAVQQTNPLPLQVLAFIPEILPGDMPEEQVRARPSNGGRRAA
jgi:hypothetical protein